MKRFSCTRCGKRSTTEDGVAQHIDAKHGGKGDIMDHGAVGDDDDESFADRAIQAMIDDAMGIPTDDDWLLPY
ncbi:MAG: hypothetical protein O9972_39760 [Burkholderiales bacterium]|nr:hypothetical protein [Burkholderiales bacterium]